jgi:UDP-N-acetylglucosamine--N-acetylmuramyl-(pentapeptide) pyrophosphoryl-undecaprenol N-acetylglucosamine transferase
VYPALSILQSVGDRAGSILWVGGEGGMEADLVANTGVAYQSIPAAGVHGVGLRALPGNIIKLLKGIVVSRKILREFNPDVLLFTGGYVAVPMALAAMNKPSLLYVPDIEPGLALRSLSRFSDLIALTAEESIQYFSSHKKLVVTGYPTRLDFAPKNKKIALKKLGLNEGLPVLMVIGGSKGAHSINEVVFSHLPELLQGFQVLHITGKPDFEHSQLVKADLPQNIARNYHSFPYLHQEISDAFSAADLALSRAGASILGELPLMGLPAVLVPYPFAWRYQKVNADFLVKHGAARIIENANLNELLVSTIQDLFNDPRTLQSMRSAMSALATPQASSKLADIVCALGSAPGGGPK